MPIFEHGRSASYAASARSHGGRARGAHVGCARGLTELEAFIAVVETGSLASASVRLGLPRSTLARRVDALEARAGAELLFRESKGAAPTAAGEQLLPRARKLLEQASSVLNGLSEARSIRGRVRVMICSGLAPGVLGHSFAALRSMFPELDYTVDSSTVPVGGDLERYELVMHWGDGPARTDWQTESLVNARVWAVATNAYLAERGTPRSVDELSNHVLISWRAPSERHDRWPLLDGETLPVKPALKSADAHFLRQVARRDVGIALVPDLQVPEPDVGPERFQPVVATKVGGTATLAVSGPSRVLQLPRIQALLGAIRSLLAALETQANAMPGRSQI
ncbi:MAG: LysR family transcriptional regulator [Myxococcota bacterium]